MTYTVEELKELMRLAKALGFWDDVRFYENKLAELQK